MIQSFYKIKNLAKYGIFLLISIFIVLLVGQFIIPEFKVKSYNKQLITLNGIVVKHMDEPFVSHFFKSIKKNNGYLCLGTSESGSLSGGNYYNFLNNDPNIKCRFSLLSGAGRVCGVYIPLFLSNRNVVDSLKIIYFINPVYWRDGLSTVDLEYWERYANIRKCKNVNISDKERELYYKQVEEYFHKEKFFKEIAISLEYYIRKARRSYFQDLKYFIKPEDYKNNISVFSDKKCNLDEFKNFGKIDCENIDTVWNKLYTFKSINWFKPIDENENYRYKELESFIALCRDLGINATFLIGPYNARFIENYDKKSLAAYEQTTQKIKSLLIKEKANFIDATDLNYTAGAFNDHQHHSSYGAYLIYNKIKEYVKEKDSTQVFD